MIDFSLLDWDRVFDVLQAQQIPDFDKELVAIALEKAVKTWGPADKPMEIVSTETYTEDPFPLKIDIHLFDPVQERRKIVDWKTKLGGELDDRWAMKQSRSWQFKLYAAAIASIYGPDVFPIIAEIRGIVLAEKPKVRTIPMIFTRTDAEAAIHQIRMIEAERRSLIEYGKLPWIKDPAGCRAFGDLYKCEFEQYCWPSEKDGLVQIPIGHMERAERPFSHSSSGEFLRCPERYRLLRVLDKEDEDDAVTGKGNAFHACEEEIYSQMKLLSSETNSVSNASEDMNPKENK